MAKPSALRDLLGEIYLQTATWMKFALTSRFNRCDAEDLTHSTFVRLALAPAEDVRHPKALLMTVATNLARDEHRRIARQGGTHLSLDEAYAENEPWTSPDQETALLLKQIILSMPTLYREVFVLSRFAGLSYEEIAERCNVSVKAVEWRMSKALAHCAAQLRD
jgi:RNA polymerase sigma factor (sigma-70 family)